VRSRICLFVLSAEVPLPAGIGRTQTEDYTNRQTGFDDEADLRVLEFNAQKRTFQNAKITAAMNSRYAVKVDGQAASQWKLKCV
jgi:hypothetical protein